MRRALLAATLLLLAGCNSGPTDPDRTETLTGVLARSASSVSTISMRHTGNLRATTVTLEQVAADGTVTPGSTLTFTIGQGDVTTCTATGNFALLQDSVLSLGLEKGSYCIKLTEPTAVAEGASLRYSVRLDITD